jgi:hypothetical protein
MTGQSPLSMMQADRRPPRRPAGPTQATDRRPHRRLWTILGPIAVIVVLAGGWSALWYYAANVADRTLAGWMAREAAGGRIYTCGTEGISGFPFLIQTHCTEAAATLNAIQPPLAVAAKDITFTAQVLRPTRLVGDIIGPLTVAAPGQAPSFTANWSSATITVSGLPPEPDAVSVSLVQPQLSGAAGTGTVTLFAADDTDFQARITEGSANDHPVIDAVLHLAAATAPGLHSALAKPVQGDIEVVLRGFNDLAPKPFAQRFRELQASGGSIAVKSLRLERSDATVIGNGTLTVKADGKLDGVINVAISGIENVVPDLGIDKMIGQGIDKLAGISGQSGQGGLAALDRLMPGLSGVVTQGANASLIDDLKKMGQPTEIDGKPATALPLRFSDGAVYLGMIRIGEVPALF